MKDEHEKRFFDIKKAAEFLHSEKEELDRLVEEKRIPHSVLPFGKILFDPERLRDWVMSFEQMPEYKGQKSTVGETEKIPFAEQILRKFGCIVKTRNKYINISGVYVVAGMQHIDNMLNIMKFPDKWKSEKIAEPTQLCKMLAKDVATIIYYSEKLIPIRISPSIEEGITITYFNPEVNRTLIIEAYNDGDVAGLVNQDKTILLSRNIVDDDFEEILDVFRDDS